VGPLWDTISDWANWGAASWGGNGVLDNVSGKATGMVVLWDTTSDWADWGATCGHSDEVGKHFFWFVLN